jgi:hypothetical protein
MSEALVPQEVIENKIYLIRGQKVMLDSDLAQLYEVETRYLNKQVKRNLDRFPEDFMFQLTLKELDNLMFQNGTSSLKTQLAVSSWGGHRKLPFAFTEQGLAMLSGVLRSKIAVHVNVAIMRAFVRLRRVIASNKELAHKLEQLEQKVGKHSEDIQLIFQAIHKLMEPVPKVTKRIGF